MIADVGCSEVRNRDLERIPIGGLADFESIEMISHAVRSAPPFEPVPGWIDHI